MRLFFLNTVMAVLFAISLNFSSLCNAVYYNTKVIVQTLQGDEVVNLERVKKSNVTQDLNQIPHLDSIVSYLIPSEFEATCKSGLTFPYEMKDVRYLRRRVQDDAFKEITRPRLVQFYESVNLGNKPLGWSIFLKPDSNENASEYIIYNEDSEKFKALFGTAILRDTMISITGTATGFASSAMPWYVSTDSVSLIETLKSQWGGDPCDYYNDNDNDPCANGGSVSRTITLQLVTVDYDTIPPVTVGSRTAKSSPSIKVSHYSGGVRIEMPIDAHIFNVLKVYSLSGDLVSEINSINNLFEWNVAGEAGKHYAPGLYFFRAGGYSGKFYLNSSR